MKVALLAQADVSLGNIKTRVLRTFPVAPTRAAVEAARRAGIKIVYLKMGFLPDL